MNDKVRWGLLSTAHINRRVIPAIRQSSRGELVAVASRSAATAQAYARKWAIPHAFGSYEAMLASGAVDAVYITLPNHLHAEWAVNALAAGLHVLCEKPFAQSIEEVDAVIAAADRHGRTVFEAFMYRFHPQMRILGQWLARGRLGQVIAVHSRFGFDLQEDRNVRLVPEWGGGSLWDIGVYPLSLAQYVFGCPPEQVYGVQRIGPTGVDVAFAGLLDYPGGGLAQIESSFRTPFHQHALIVGTEGRIEIARPYSELQDFPEGMVFYDARGRREVVPVLREELYLGEIEAMHAAVLDGTPPLLSLAETRDHVRTAVALYRSAREGRPVPLDA
jgi:predicted dehydrogenase